MGTGTADLSERSPARARPVAAGDHLSRAARLAPWLAFASAILLIAVVSRRPQGLHFYDPTLQSIALRQWAGGESPNPNILVRVDPLDASRNVSEWLSWWPPSLQILAAPLVVRGISLGAALRAIFALAAIVAAIGWAIWIRQFRLPPPVVVVLAVALPWLRHFSENAFRYSAETLSFALAPWLILLAAKLPARIAAPAHRSHLILALSGLALGAAYLAKYSLFLFVASLLAFVAWETRRAWFGAGRTTRSVAALLILGATTLAVPMAVRIVNAHFSAADPVSAGARHGFDPFDLLFAFANPALALADAQGPLFHLLVFPGWLLPDAIRSAAGGSHLLAWIGFPAGILLAIVLVRFWREPDQRADACGRLAAFGLAVNALAVLALWQFADVDHSARHLAPAALAVLPLALREGIASWHRRTRVMRGMLVAGAIGFIAMPIAYGFAYVGLKIRSIPADYRAGESGLLLPTLSRTNAATVASALKGIWTPNAVWILEDPEMALELPGRFMLAYGDRDVGHEFQRLFSNAWRKPGDLATSRPVRLLLLLARQDSAAADEAHRQGLTRTMAKTTGPWRQVEVPAGNCVLWINELAN